MSCCNSTPALQQAAAGLQRNAALARRSAESLSAPASSAPELQPRDSLRDIVDLSSASRGMQANAVVFSVASDMADIALSIGAHLDQYA